MKAKAILAALSLAIGAAFTPQGMAQTREVDLDRAHLPMPNTTRPRSIVYDAKNPDSKNPPINQLRPPKGAPNVLVILVDDAGFGSTSTYGGPCQTPTLEKLAAGGLKYNRFHTTAICSPTRQALLTGRNHHSVGMAGITEIATGAPG
ncbi:MAG: sulfatase-like hydrolase/transferase, partial [Pirellulaceae bacterium]